MTEKANGFQSVTDYVGSYFNDVEESSPFYDAIMWAVGTGIAQGASETMFDPNSYSSRGQTVFYLWRAVGSPQVVRSPSQIEPEWLPPETGDTAQNSASEISFTDVKESDEYYQAILWASQNGITNGTSSTTFEPDARVTRGQAQTFLYRLAASPEATGENPFMDVEAGRYYYQAILWAVQNGIARGTTEMTFEPNGTLTKAQILTFIYRYAVESN